MRTERGSRNESDASRVGKEEERKELSGQPNEEGGKSKDNR